MPDSYFDRSTRRSPDADIVLITHQNKSLRSKAAKLGTNRLRPTSVAFLGKLLERNAKQGKKANPEIQPVKFLLNLFGYPFKLQQTFEPPNAVSQSCI